MSKVISIIIALLIFGLLVLIHEFGHFILAKKNNIIVNEFSIGMGPRLFSFTKNGTIYSIKCLPFGGSCAMLGEDEDVEIEGSFNSKSVWARIAVVFAGPLFNFVLAFVLSLIIIAFVGTDLSYVTSVDESSPAYEAGLREGDRITNYDGTNVSLGRDIYLDQYVKQIDGDEMSITYERDGKKQTVEYVPSSQKSYMVGMGYSANDTKAELSSISKGSAIEEAGAVMGDVVVEIDGTKIKTGKELEEYLIKNPFSDKETKITLESNGDEKVLNIKPTYTTMYDPGFDYNLSREKQSVFGVVKYSFVELRYQVSTVFKSLKMLITGKVSAEEVSGPVGIVSVIGDTYESSKASGMGMTILSLINLAIMLSANLGVMNLLPIPALDGGRIVFCIIEVITRKPIPKDKEGMVHFAGFAVLMFLMVFLVFNDIRKLI